MGLNGDQSKTEVVRGVLGDLFEESRLYKDSQDYQDLLDFVVRLRNFAPFNAMLLQLQKPGLSYAASARDWSSRYGRQIAPGVRPLLILRPFGPVALVYDVMDTIGDDLPEDVACFVATGDIDTLRMEHFQFLLERKNILCDWVDAGDRDAGSICRLCSRLGDDIEFEYQVTINENHISAIQFGSLVHELAHLHLGHLGPDQKLGIPARKRPNHAQREIEAESVSYIVCKRNGVEPKSKTYLSNFIKEDTTPDSIDIYQIMRAAGQVETVLNLRN